MDALKLLGHEWVAQLGGLEGSLSLLRQLREQRQQLSKRRSEPELDRLIFEAGYTVAAANLEALFASVEAALPRTLLAQVVVAFYLWEPPSLAIPTVAFDQRRSECLAIDALIERLAEATGEPAREILCSLPEPLASHLVNHRFLNSIRRPLALLWLDADGSEPLGEPQGVRCDAAIVECEAARQQRQRPGARYAPPPLRRRRVRSEAPRGLLLQCQPLGHAEESHSRLQAQPAIDLLRFSAEEVYASFGAGERVLNFVLDHWGWKALPKPTPF